MKHLLALPFFCSRYPFALVAGLCWAASFPKIGLSGLAWVAPGLLLASALGTRGWESFRVGYVGGVAHYLTALYWLLLIPYRWHSIPLGPLAGWLALGAFLALFPAMWIWLICGSQNPVANIHIHSAEQTAGIGASPRLSMFPATWLARAGLALTGATVWVALEMLIARIFTGFPWDLFGVSQYQLIPLIQIVSVTGIYGISFLLVWTSLCLLSAAITLLRRPTQRGVWLAEIILPLTTLVILFGFGFHQLRRVPASNRTLKVTFVQPSIPQTLIWDTSKDDERFRELVSLSEQALTNQPDLLLWPEAAVPKLLRWNKETFEAVTGLARRHHVWMILGADDLEPKPGATTSENADYFNSSFLIAPDGSLMNGYRKRALVIFGEYIPLVTWLPLFKFFTPIQGGFTRGDRAIPFELTDLHVKTSTLICFEDIFPHLAREYVDADTDFLVNLTNNGWFGESAAQWQHAMSALFRAVENGCPLLRCSNNGLTCWVDSHGRIRQVFRDAAGTVYGPGCMTASIPLLNPGGLRTATFYNRHGDWFGWACVGWGVLTLFTVAIKQIRFQRATRSDSVRS